MSGRVAERLNAAVLKTVDVVRRPGVQIPPLPPRALEKHGKPLAQGDTGMVKSNLAKLMKEKKLTYRRLAELSGVAGETINRARGTLIYECKLSTLDALAKVLDVNIKDLFDEN